MRFKERVRRRNEFDASIVYGTRKFNLITKRVEHAQYRQKHDTHWEDGKTGIICKKYAEYRKCPLCGLDSYQTLFVKAGFPHVQCNNCSLVYVNPILNETEYKKLWRAEDSWEDVLETKEQVRMQTLEARYSLDIAGLYLIPRGIALSICDVGCGPGTLLEESKRRGHYVFGIEPNVRCYKLLQKKGIDFTVDFFPLKSAINKKFDCVFLLNTLEHLRQPFETLKEIVKLLKPHGIVYISVPCIDALVNRIMHEKAGVFGGHSHIQFFSSETLSVLLQKCGFKVLEYETIISEIGVIKNYLSYKDPYFGSNAQALEFITPEFIYKNHLARNINMVGRLRRQG